MMRIVVCFLLILPPFFSRSQELDFRDYRSKRENFSRVREKDIRSDLATFTMAGISESLGKTPLKQIPETDYGGDYMEFKKDNIEVRVNMASFDPSKHKLTYIEKNLVKIDNKPYYGNYGNLPSTSIESVVVVVGKDTIPIPPIAYSDIHDINFGYRDASGILKSLSAVYFSGDNRNMYVYLLSKGNKRSFEVTWVIQDKKYLKRVLDYGL